MPDLPRPLRATLCVVGHVFLCGAALAGIWALEQWTHFLWGDTAPKLFDLLPVRYLFDASDLGIMTAFGVGAVFDAANAMKEK